MLVSLCHYVTMSLCHYVTMSLCHKAIALRLRTNGLTDKKFQRYNTCTNPDHTKCPIVPAAAHKCHHHLLQGLGSLVCLLFCLLALNLPAISLGPGFDCLS